MSINDNLIYQLKSLSKEERLTVMQILFDIDSDTRREHKITELAGLGKEIWNNKETEKYIEEERSN